MGTLEETVFKDKEPMMGFCRLCQGGQCPHSDENAGGGGGDRNREELVGKQVDPRQSPGGCLRGWGAGEKGRRSKYICSRRFRRKILYPSFFPQNVFHCIPG